MTIKNTIADRDLEALRAAIAGFVAGQAGYDQARQAWNLAVDQQPSVVVEAESAADVAQAVRYARARAMRDRRISCWSPCPRPKLRRSPDRPGRATARRTTRRARQ